MESGISTRLEALIATCTTLDLEFEAEEIRGHKFQDDVRTGFRLVRIAGVALPTEIRLAYVIGKRATDEYAYVVVWSSIDAVEPEIRDVSSVESAKVELWNALKLQVKLNEQK